MKSLAGVVAVAECNIQKISSQMAHGVQGVHSVVKRVPRSNTTEIICQMDSMLEQCCFIKPHASGILLLGMSEKKGNERA
eukprot:3923988-Ditylum_brightwellii.AAC.1